MGNGSPSPSGTFPGLGVLIRRIGLIFLWEDLANEEDRISVCKHIRVLLNPIPLLIHPANLLGTNLQCSHNPTLQLLQLLSRAGLRFLVTAALCSIQASIFLHYSRKPFLTSHDKTTFNFLKTLVYLCIGLNVAGSFKSVSLMLRWKLLARRKHTLDDVDSILGLASLLKVCGLAWRSARRGRIRVAGACVAWVVFNAVGRTGIALTGLGYEIKTTEVVRTGEVFLPDLNFITGKKDFGLELNTAHTIGGASWLASSILNKPLDYAGEPGHFRYVLPRFPTPGSPKSLPSPYHINITSTCDSWPIIQGGDGSTPNIIYQETFQNGTTRNVPIDSVQEVSAGATIYINPRSDHNIEHVCTDVGRPQRCSRVAVIHLVGREETGGNAIFFDCEVEVSEILGERREGFEYRLSDQSAWVAAGSIGLSGFGSGVDRWDYVRFYKGYVPPYSPSSSLTLHRSALASKSPTAAQIANITAEFATHAIAGLAHSPLMTPGYLQITGTYLHTGEKLLIKPFLWSIYAALLFAQFTVALASAIYANSVFVKDDSYLSTARPLKRKPLPSSRSSLC